VASRAPLPIVFGPPERSLVGWYHAPRAATRDLAVLLCSPLGYEALSAHRTYRHMAERFSAGGYASLRFDYPGTGDSAGSLETVGRVPTWIDSIKTAAEELRARSGAMHVALFGVRLGATLAALAAPEIANVEALVLWAPIIGGRAHARELRAFDMMKKRGRAVAAGEPRKPGVEVGGYFLAQELLDDLSRIDLVQTSPYACERVLIIPRGEPASPEELRLAGAMSAQGLAVHLHPGTGYAAMMRDDPYMSVVPSAGLDAVVRWTSERPHREAQPASTERPHATMLKVKGDDDGSRAVWERPLLFGDRRELVGVLTEPNPLPSRARPALIFLNVGANQHVGPHRMNVELARELGSLGYLTFRMDAAGLGESPAAPGTPENRIYTKDAIADVEAAMALLRETQGAQRFVLVGLCSGAYLAYHTAARNPCVAGQVLLSPYAFEWKEGDPVAPTSRKIEDHHRSTQFYLRALRDPQVWARTLRGEVNPRGMALAIRERIAAIVQAELLALRALARGALVPRNDVERTFRAMSDAGVRTLVVLSFEDSGVDMIARYLGSGARRLRGHRNFEMKIIEGIDHAFESSASQAVLRREILGYVTSRFP
jgi:alpha-beta hydrolase superfamily lysophospholipase